MLSKKIALVWFKTNLRLQDNECLAKAVAENDLIVPFYCMDDELIGTSKFGFKKTGDFRLKFLKESLQQLDEELRSAGSGLVLLNGISEKVIFKLAKEQGAQRIYAEKEVAPEELNTQQKVAGELSKLNCTFSTFECRNLLHSVDLPFPIGQLPDVFTEFRKRIEKTVAIRQVLPKPPSIASPEIEAMNLTLITSNVIADPRAAIEFEGGAKAAHERIQHYFYQTKALSTYKETRNGMVGEQYSSKFSAWLALGCISPREIYEAIRNYEAIYGANDSTYWLIFELLWRDFFGFCMEKNSLRYFLPSSNQQLKSADNEQFKTKLKKWINGQTGVPFIDANMIELKLTGFMSNRGRQNVASYFCNDLQLDWRYGAAYFEQQLIDYDVCNNWGNWAYLAGVGNDPRLNRYFNIAKQALTYDPNNAFQHLWLL
ncbi:DASH family cryptochrome [Mucilaginibacter polytrichastri]|uniref:Cryptochrome DASH n=1 Tax=Mucilaginibacter polytrichastri TaxID=1302689 RepID=A0A1Q6A069_9SPHI|nr:DASH family cryptochrome [Mucilaginibacter polytrichastri]OKS87415.1 Cryptochrome DASH [Mucilaginibacter polytrichastri]SFS90356.1 deoxyribodipyrimidine photo-lyase (single-stranded DNA-specific) [Mucilaginibacter polytrichastri]